MQLDLYQQLSRRTLNLSHDQATQRLNALCGLCGETAELLEVLEEARANAWQMDRARLTAEAGDIAFYAAWLATLDEQLLSEYLRASEALLHVFDERAPLIYGVRAAMHAGMALDAIKKVVFHHHAYEAVRERIRMHAATAFAYVCAVVRLAAIDPCAPLEHNVAKLRARYPHGFSSGAAG